MRRSGRRGLGAAGNGGLEVGGGLATFGLRPLAGGAGVWDGVGWAGGHSVQGRGIGSLLLIDALRRAQHRADHVGMRAVEVDAIDEAGRQVDLRFGFVPLLDDPNHLFLSLRVIRELGLPPLVG